ncbi:MAG TPA: radical SAM family heme chaperone HemW [Thermoanaerobaculia bacterium]|nr:radical SAM family heme chaperone HemW [Thermoanaerobaculia bacterium]
MEDRPVEQGIYVHLPFCRVKCSYCAFAVSTDLRLEDAYGDALLREIELRTRPRASADSLFWGGGTPSRSSFQWLSRIDGALRSRFDLAPSAEVTLEANPEDLTPAAIEQWRQLGVNRLSIGVQSFQDSELIPLGRIHGRARALSAVELAVASGLRTSLDLILGLPGQTAESFGSTLQTAIDSGVGHLSMYMLDLEPESALAGRVSRGATRLPEEDTTSEIYLEAVERVSAAGFAQYEISNFARPGEESRHNLRYWQREVYAGFGVGAHSFDGSVRRGNIRNVRDYIDRLAAGRDPVEMLDPIGEGELRRERIFLSLRRVPGIEYPDLLNWTDGRGAAWCERGIEEGWLRITGSRVAFTPRGFLLSSELLSELF